MEGLSLGPRYMCFHQGRHVCYVVNELSSQVAVLQYRPKPNSNPNPNSDPSPNPNPHPNPHPDPNQVAVFQYHPEVASEIDSMFARTAPQLRAELLRSCKPTLSLVQTVSTLPSAFPRELNTCGPMSKTRPAWPAGQRGPSGGLAEAGRSSRQPEA